MPEKIHESVSVDLVSEDHNGRIYPRFIKWHNRLYRITQVGLHHWLRKGRTLIHIFSVTDGNLFFRLAFDTDTLRWTLEEIEEK